MQQDYISMLDSGMTSYTINWHVPIKNIVDLEPWHFFFRLIRPKAKMYFKY